MIVMLSTGKKVGSIVGLNLMLQSNLKLDRLDQL